MLTDILANFQNGLGSSEPLAAVLHLDNANLEPRLFALFAKESKLWIDGMSIASKGTSLDWKLYFVPAGSSLLQCAEMEIEASDFSALKRIVPDAWSELKLETE